MYIDGEGPRGPGRCDEGIQWVAMPCPRLRLARHQLPVVSCYSRQAPLMRRKPLKHCLQMAVSPLH